MKGISVGYGVSGEVERRVGTLTRDAEISVGESED
jgi:hypothetical protein